MSRRSEGFYSMLAEQVQKPTKQNVDGDQDLLRKLNSQSSDMRSIVIQLINEKRFHLLYKPLNNGNTLLHKLLLSKKADFLLAYYEKLLNVARENRTGSSARYLKEIVRAKDNRGRTPLLVACMMADTATACRLIELDLERASINVLSKEGYGPLHIAYLFGMQDVIRVLYAAGADKNKEDGCLRKPGEYIRLGYYQCRDEIAQVLGSVAIDSEEHVVKKLHSANMHLLIDEFDQEAQAFKNYKFDPDFDRKLLEHEEMLERQMEKFGGLFKLLYACEEDKPGHELGNAGNACCIS